jgi:hypothetical protein
MTNAKFFLLPSATRAKLAASRKRLALHLANIRGNAAPKSKLIVWRKRHSGRPLPCDNRRLALSGNIPNLLDLDRRHFPRGFMQRTCKPM